MKRMYLYVVPVFLAMTAVCGYFYFFSRWKHLWTKEPSHRTYHVISRQDDTLRVIMVGDSWAGMHHPFDGFFQNQLRESIGSPVLFESKGKGGEKTRGILQMMCEETRDGIYQLIMSTPDYCIISAGINDAAANLGTDQYCYYYLQILELLLDNQIKPVVLEFPNVNIWTVYQEKPIKDLCVDYLRSLMTHCRMYDYSDYRKALKSTLAERHLMDSVLYIPASEWNGITYDVILDVFGEDQIHLNKKGYELLDSCIAKKIADDYKKRKKSILPINQ